MSAYTVKADPNADLLLMAMPLGGEVSRAIAADLNAAGRGKCCAGCDKPFSAARKQRAVGRITHADPSGQLFTTTWLFCGTCAAAIRRNDGRIPVHLVQEARDATAAGLLLAAPAGGTA